MTIVDAKKFGAAIGSLIQKKDLGREECRVLFHEILNNTQNDMQQGAFLAALASKGETIEEIAGVWEAVYQLDTVQVKPNVGDLPLVDNCGTGMDSFKTFNISTAASVIAAAAGTVMARHGARAITSSCGTVDMVEALGVDVECDPGIVVKSIEEAGVGVFNGMSPRVHPRALGRILSQISFGTVLNIAASLANPALPEYGVRGVCSGELLQHVPHIMREIGYRRAVVVNGLVAGSPYSMDEASTAGETLVAELHEDGAIRHYSFYPEDFGIRRSAPDELLPGANLEEEVRRMVALLVGEGSSARREIASLNAGLILYVSGAAPDIREGYHTALETIRSGKAMEKLYDWVRVQNTDPSGGIARLNSYLN
jgi:anthranilate phosphoribosyltransferase